MGITKTDAYTEDINQMASVFKALGHPARMSIMIYLAKTPSCICNEIVSALPLAQPTISRHLAELKKAGLIKGTIEGNNICYCIDENKWADIREVVLDLSSQLEKQNKCC